MVDFGVPFLIRPADVHRLSVIVSDGNKLQKEVGKLELEDIIKLALAKFMKK